MQFVQAFVILIQTEHSSHWQHCTHAGQDAERYEPPAVFGDPVCSVAQKVIKKCHEQMHEPRHPHDQTVEG
jgi:hypothetical protein